MTLLRLVCCFFGCHPRRYRVRGQEFTRRGVRLYEKCTLCGESWRRR